jgi:hypothetical protein
LVNIIYTKNDVEHFFLYMLLRIWHQQTFRSVFLLLLFWWRKKLIPQDDYHLCLHQYENLLCYSKIHLLFLIDNNIHYSKFNDSSHMFLVEKTHACNDSTSFYIKKIKIKIISFTFQTIIYLLNFLSIKTSMSSV